MALHRLLSIVMGVPQVKETADYYTEFGLRPDGDGWFATEDGGRQLRIVHAPTRTLLALHVGVDSPDDLDRAAAALGRLGFESRRGPDDLEAVEPATGVRAVLTVAPRLRQAAVPPTPYNGPGRVERPGVRAPGVLRTGSVRPRLLGHAVVGSPDYALTHAFFADGLGFRVSDHIKGQGAFLRCSEDHHNLLVLRSPVAFLHHTAWQVDDVDEVGRGAQAMLEGRPERHVWGLGRHYLGSNFFWYLKDPAGNFSEYYSDMDCVPEDQLWTPEDLEDGKGLFAWGPPPPPSFVRPEDLAARMTGAHSAKGG
ncbi:VOC family protein [Streptomyces sp. NPDC048290]|uniref:VOC family protein n=1 Tax=Streptomyces sp. NPDC048290 TaxID=3155811 RepID=UPI00343028A0